LRCPDCQPSLHLREVIDIGIVVELNVSGNQIESGPVELFINRHGRWPSECFLQNVNLGLQILIFGRTEHDT